MTYNTINDAQTMQGGGTGTVLAGRYRILRQLGQGGMGSVWLAEDTQLDNKPFAIKMLPSILVSNKRAYRQLKDEALVAMKLTHPNIVTLRAFEENNGNPFLVMDYVEGESLDDYLADKGKLSEEEIIRVLHPIAAALDYAHAKGVVHRDVKPGNVMIAKDGTPYILDFGIAREIQETLTRVTGKLSSGTLLYMSPEQLMGESPKPAQDIYSFAAMAYECLKGEPPFVRGAIEDQIKNKQPDPPPGGTQLVASVMSGLAKKPEDRPATCVAVLEGKGDFSRNERKEVGGSRSRATETGEPRLVRLGAQQSGRTGAPRLPQGDGPGRVDGGGGRTRLASALPQRGSRRVMPTIGEIADVRMQSKRQHKSRVRVVCSLTAAVLVLIAMCVAYFASPRIYEAKSEFTMDTRRPEGGNGIGVAGNDMDFYGADYAEIFNTRQSDWRSEGIFTKILQQYRANYPNSQVTDKELVEMLASSELELVRHSRLITIAVRSKRPELAAALANAYAEALESFTDEENKKRCDKAVAQIHEQVEKQRRVDDDLAARLLKFRTENNIDNLQAEQTILNQSIQTAMADVQEYEKRVTVATEWVKVLQTAQKNLESFGELPTEVPRSTDIAAAYTKLQTVKMELATLKTRYTPEHPEVVAKEGNLKAISTEFDETVKRALATAQGDLTANQNQLNELKRRSEDLNKRIAAVGQNIVQADMGLKQLEQEKKVSSEIYKDLLQKENEHRIAAEQNNEIVRVGRPAQIPTEPVLPNPKIIFGFGGILLLVIAALNGVCNMVFRARRRERHWYADGENHC